MFAWGVSLMSVWLVMGGSGRATGTQPATRPAGNAATRPAPATQPAVVLPFIEQSISGNTIIFPDAYAGKLVLVNFWASWCPFSRKELSYWRDAQIRYHEQGLEILGVAVDKNKRGTLESLQKFLVDNSLPWEQIYDHAPELAQMYQVDTLPTSLLVDGSTGRIIARGQVLRRAGLARLIEANLSKVAGDASTRPAP